MRRSKILHIIALLLSSVAYFGLPAARDAPAATRDPVPSGLPDRYTNITHRDFVNGEFDHVRPMNEYVDDVAGFSTSSQGIFIPSMETSPSLRTEGSSSLKVTARGVTSSGVQGYVGQYRGGNMITIRYNTTMTFDWRISSMPVLADNADLVAVVVQLNNSRYIYAMLAGWYDLGANYAGINATGHNMLGSWYTVSVNLTQVYIARFGSFTSNVSISTVSIVLWQATSRDAAIILHVDRMSVRAGAVEKLWDGGFETWSGSGFPSFWGTADQRAPALKSSAVSQSGGKSLRLHLSTGCETPGRTVSCVITMAASSAFAYQSAHVVSANHALGVNFSYRIEELPSSDYYEAYYTMQFHNGTHYKVVYFVLASANVYANSSGGPIYCIMPSTPGTWHTYSKELWPLVSTMYAGQPSNLTSMELYAYTSGASQENMTVYLERFGLRTTTLVDGQFEHPDAPGRIQGWEPSGPAHLAYSATSKTGSYAGNFTKIEGTSLYAHHAYPAIIADKNVRFRFDLDVVNCSSRAYDMISMVFSYQSLWNESDHLEVWLPLVYKPIFAFSISSQTGVVYLDAIEGANPPSKTWQRIDRNLHEDMNRAFDPMHLSFPPSSYFLRDVAIIMNSQVAGEQLTVLLDDIVFYTENDVEPPEILDASPSTADARMAIPITFMADVRDTGIGVAAVTLVYSMDGWTTNSTAAMSPQGTGAHPGAQLFSVSITVGSLLDVLDASILSYRVVATDGFGNSASSTTRMIMVREIVNAWQAGLIGMGLLGLVLVIIVSMVKKRKKGGATPSNPPKKKR
nr:hypothetical protein [Candidatus Sigynarchaeum springense]